MTDKEIPTAAYEYKLDRKIDGKIEVLEGATYRNPENFDYDHKEFIYSLVRREDVLELIDQQIEKAENRYRELQHKSNSKFEKGRIEKKARKYEVKGSASLLEDLREAFQGESAEHVKVACGGCGSKYDTAEEAQSCECEDLESSSRSAASSGEVENQE